MTTDLYSDGWHCCHGRLCRVTSSPLIFSLLGWFLGILLIHPVVTWAAQAKLTPAEQQFLEDNSPIVFVSQSQYPPFEFLENGERTGMTIELARWMATELGFSARFLDSAFQEAQNLVIDGKAHVLTSLFYSDLREKKFDFTKAIFKVPAYIFVRSERTDIKALKDLDGKRIAMQAGDYAKEFLDNHKITYEPLYTQNFAQATDLVIAQTADAVIGDEQIVWYHVYKNRLVDQIKIVGKPLYTGENCMAVKDGNRVLAGILDKGIALARQTGTLDKINRKWLGIPLKPEERVMPQAFSQLILAMSLAVILLILIWLWNVRLRKLVAKRTAELESSENQYRTLIENVNVGVYRTTSIYPGHFIKLNPALARIFGYNSEKELADVPVAELYVDPQERSALIDQLLLEGSVKGKVMEMRRKDGSHIWVACTATAEFDSDGNLKWIDGIIEDITKRKQHEDQLSYHAYHDPLTGLLNRNALFERLEECVKNALRYDRQLAVLFIDLDHFKKVNDNFGHEYGDEVLRQVARRFKKILREADLVFRFGGDEFAVVLPGSKSLETGPVADKIVVELSRSYHVNSKVIDFVCPSIGIAICPKHGVDGKTLLRCADKAMYRAKSAPSKYMFGDCVK